MQGYDTFFEKPDEIKIKICRVCDSVCNIKKNQFGPISWAGAMARKEVPYDYFYCPHINEDWHQQALALVQAIENTPSKRIADLMKLDLEDILVNQIK